jgi:CxxC-x17-CxxC domain-containing protein
MKCNRDLPVQVSKNIGDTMYKDKNLTCRDCGKEFVFSTSEQEFYAEKGFQNDPVRCPDCRSAKKAQSRGGGFGRGERQMYDVICSSCGKPTQVPFKPSNDKPVYCRDCFTKNR